MRYKLRWGDALIIISIVLTAILVFVSFYQGNATSTLAVITQNNEIIGQIQLEHLTESISINYSSEYPGTIEASDGKIRFSHAECPDQVCVNTGWISRPGEIAVCLPAGVIIKIEGEDSDLDIMVR